MNRMQMFAFSAFILFIIGWCASLLKTLTILIGLLCIVLSIIYNPFEKKGLMGSLLVILIFTGFMPLDISFINVEGPPRIIEPCDIQQSPEILEGKLLKNECYLASDISRPFEPWGILVW